MAEAEAAWVPGAKDLRKRLVDTCHASVELNSTAPLCPRGAARYGSVKIAYHPCSLDEERPGDEVLLMVTST